ncbi:hypothetical protein B0T39_24310 [Chromobacterium haemolyticum]|nr:hypothetical protein B0T39_24310 [Chromobacterium haemolyticum]
MASPLVVQLTQRAKVEAFRGDILLNTYYLDGGMHVLDTTLFPEGSYQIVLRIHDNGGGERHEIQSFTKNSMGLGYSDLAWFFQAGQVVNQSEKRADNSHSAQIGMRFMPMTGLRLSVGVSAFSPLESKKTEWPISKSIFHELKVEWRKPTVIGNLDFSASHMQSANRDIVSRAHTVAWNNGIGAQISHYQQVTQNCALLITAVQRFSGCRQSFNVNLYSNNLFSPYGVTLGYTRSHEQMFGQTPRRVDSKMLGLSHSKRWGGFNLNTQVNVFSRQNVSRHANRQRGGMLTLSMSRATPHSDVGRQTTTNLNLQAGRKEGSGVGSYRLEHAASQQNGSQRSWGLAVGGDQSNGVNLAHMSATSTGRFGDNQAVIDMQRQVNKWGSQFSLAHRSTFALSREGMGWGPGGGGGVAPSGILLKLPKLDGASGVRLSRQAGFELDAPHDTMTFLGVDGYQSDKISLHGVADGSDASDIHLQGLPHHPSFLTPGRIRSIHVNGGLQFSYAGRFQAEGISLMGATILGTSSQLDEREGALFQTSSRLGKVLNLSHPSHGKFLCDLVPQRHVAGLVYLGTSQCRLLESIQEAKPHKI